MKASRKSPAGFSLVELVIALGVTSFCLLSIMGLLVVGLQGTKTTGQQTVAAQIGSDVIADIRSTPPPTGGSGSYSPRFNLQVYNADGTVATGLAVCFLDEQENAQTTVTGPPNSSVYRVTVQLTPPPATNPPQRLATSLRVMVSWPAQSDPTTRQWPTNYADSWETVVGLDQN